MLHIWMEQNVLFYGMIGAGILGILCMFMVDRFYGRVEMMCQIYDYLADAGYEGNTAITDYMLAYYNNKRGTSYDNLTDLFADHPNWLDGDLVTKNGIWTMSEDELTGYIEKYPWIDSFVYATQSGDNLNIQIKWPEPELAAVSYPCASLG